MNSESIIGVFSFFTLSFWYHDISYMWKGRTLAPAKGQIVRRELPYIPQNAHPGRFGTSDAILCFRFKSQECQELTEAQKVLDAFIYAAKNQERDWLLTHDITAITPRWEPEYDPVQPSSVYVVTIECRLHYADALSVSLRQERPDRQIFL